MRILGHSCLPLSVPYMPAAWASQPLASVIANVFFFSGPIPTTQPQETLDFRLLLNNCSAAVSVALRPTFSGYMTDFTQSSGIKALSGSVYNAKRGLTLHYPRTSVIRSTATNTMAAQEVITAYGAGSAAQLLAGNRLLMSRANPELGLQGFPHQVNAQTYIGNADLTFDQSISVDAVSAQAAVITAVSPAAALQVGANAEISVSVPANVDAAVVATPQVGQTIRLRQAAGRRIILATQGDASLSRNETLSYAIVTIQDTEQGLTSVATRDTRYFLCDVGLLGSNAMIQLESLTIASGQYPAIQSILSGVEVV